MDILKRPRLFADSDRQGVEAHRTASELMDKRLNDALIHFIETIGVNIEHLERLGGRVLVDHPAGADLGKITDPAQEIVGDAGCAARAAGNLKRPLVIDLHAEQSAGAEDDFAKLFRVVVIEAAVHPEAGAER